MEDRIELKWDTKFIASDVLSQENNITTGGNAGAANKLIIKGILLDNTLNKNSWCVEEEDFQAVAKSFIGCQIRVDHAEKVSNVIGKIISTEVDTPHETMKNDWDPINLNPHVHFVGEISTTDQNLLIPIREKYIDSISPAIDALEIRCSTCGEKMLDKNIKKCGCKEPGVLLKNMTAREMSLVCSPAFENTRMVVYGFAASVDREFLSDDKILAIVEDELFKRGI